MAYIPQSIQKLINEFCKLPGIGPKTASRLTFYLLKSSEEDIEELGKAVLELKKKIVTCCLCCNIAQENPCPICKDPLRDKSQICVVEEPLDVMALEKTKEYKGTYHVLGGTISPIEGIGPENLYIRQLIGRVKKNKDTISEIILATNPSLEGEATAMYLLKILKPFDIKITRIARGLPVGGDLEYADEVTLTRALEGRKEY
jgi:recombination protein RecR